MGSSLGGIGEVANFLAHHGRLVIGRMYRCPGGKRRIASRIVEQILEQCRDRQITSYCEPFVATASVCLALLKTAGEMIQKVGLNDRDRGVFAIWWSLLNEPNELRRLVPQFNLSRKAFYQFKEDLLEGREFSLPELALRKLAIHQMSFSGLGTMARGPMTAIASRWSPPWIERNIDQARHLLAGKQAHVTNMNYRNVVSEVGEETFVYLDPPYVEAGNQLYQYSFDEYDHQQLRELLEHAKFPWVLSYNDHPEIRRMYRRDVIHEVPISYTINGLARKNELLITPKHYIEVFHDLWGLNSRTIPATLPLIPLTGKFVDFDSSSHSRPTNPIERATDRGQSVVSPIESGSKIS